MAMAEEVLTPVEELRRPGQHLAGGLGVAQRGRFLPVDVAGVQGGNQVEDRDPGLGVAGQDAALHRRRAAPGRQQGEMHVHPAARRDGQHVRGNQGAVGDDRAAVGRQLS